jgi:Uma2 family endonuclease
MKAIDYIPLYTYKDYQLWQGDWELIHGYPHAMSPSPVRKHQLIVGKLNSQFNRLFETKNGCGNCEVYSDLDWIVNDSTVVRPDVMIACGKFDDFLNFPPVLVIEVLSNSTSMKDRNIKYNLYKAQKVNYYILINPDNRVTEIFEWRDGDYVLSSECKAFVLDKNCTLEFDIADFISLLKLD